jgi:hypothetical protein
MKRILFFSLFLICSTELLAQNNKPSQRFHYIVIGESFEARFQEVYGLDRTIDITAVSEGGGNLLIFIVLHKTMMTWLWREVLWLI